MNLHRVVQCRLTAATLLVVLGLPSCRSQPLGEWLELSEAARESYRVLHDRWSHVRAMSEQDPTRPAEAAGVLEGLDAWIQTEPEFCRAKVDRQDLLLEFDRERADREFPPGAWNGSAHGALLVARYLWGEPEQAQEWIDRALELDPDFAWGWYAAATMDRDRTRWNDAAEKVERAVALDQRFPEAERLRAEILEAVGDRESTIDAWRRTLKIADADQEARYRYARALLLSDDPNDARRAESALWDVRKALEATADPPMDLMLAACNDLGVAITRQGRHQDALQWFRQCLEWRPDDLRALYNLGWTLEQLGMDEKALKAYEAYEQKAKSAQGPLPMGDTQDYLLYVPDHIRRLRDKLGLPLDRAGSTQDGAEPFPDGGAAGEEALGVRDRES